MLIHANRFTVFAAFITYVPGLKFLAAATGRGLPNARGWALPRMGRTGQEVFRADYSEHARVTRCDVSPGPLGDSGRGSSAGRPRPRPPAAPRSV